MKMKIKQYGLAGLLVALLLIGNGTSATKPIAPVQNQYEAKTVTREIAVENLTTPEDPDCPYVEINDNEPDFGKKEKSCTDAFEKYSKLDELGRCGVAYANICQEIMPTQKRGKIGNVKPSGWHTVKYNDIIDGNYLYNRCHLIGYQLAGENSNEKNLITGTRYLNVEGMLPFENMIDDYVKENDNHVLYRVTPIYEGDNLVASGVEMEAYSVEDKGKGICFHVYCYNIQPGITIDYATGDSKKDTSSQNSYEKKESVAATEAVTESANMVWISATGSKYHSKNNCGRMNPAKASQMSESDAIAKGYGKCSKCW